MKQLISTLVVFFCLFLVHAQDSTGVNPEQPGGLRADGKIYVVIAVCVTILTGLFVYLILLDRKVSKLEKNSS